MAYFFSGDGHPIHLDGFYKGASAFLICSGPSFQQLDHRQLRRPGVLTMGVNNSVKLFRPNLGCTVDDPANFIRSMWFDPTITKFVRQYYVKPHYKPSGENSSLVFDSDAWSITDMEVKDCPATVFWKHASTFDPETFLTEETISWGDVAKDVPRDGEDKRNSDVRSVMLPAMKILYLLGVRNLFLLGADFSMSGGRSYAFEQARDDLALAYNNRSYSVLRERFALLKPHFDKAGFNVFNSTEGSMLTEFPYVPFEEAVEIVIRNNRMDIDLEGERTDGLYDRQAKIKLEIESTVSTELVYETAPTGNARRIERMGVPKGGWESVPVESIRVGDRIRMWAPDGAGRVASANGVSEWTVAAVGKDRIAVLHWTRETHLRHVRNNTLKPAIGKLDAAKYVA